MSLRRISTVLLSVILVAVSVLAVQLLLFAQEWGEICVSGEIVTTRLNVSTDPLKELNPPSYVEITDKKTERTDGACTIMTCIPLDCECSELNYTPRVIERIDTQDFVRKPDGTYNPRPPQNIVLIEKDYYIGCSDDFGNYYGSPL